VAGGNYEVFKGVLPVFYALSTVSTKKKKKQKKKKKKYIYIYIYNII